MVRSPIRSWSAIQCLDIVAGAQTERRGGAGPAGACLAVRTPPAALLSTSAIRSLLLARTFRAGLRDEFVDVGPQVLPVLAFRFGELGQGMQAAYAGEIRVA